MKWPKNDKTSPINLAVTSGNGNNEFFRESDMFKLKITLDRHSPRLKSITVSFPTHLFFHYYLPFLYQTPFLLTCGCYKASQSGTMLARVMEPERTSRGFWEIVLLDPTSHQEYLASILCYPFLIFVDKRCSFSGIQLRPVSKVMGR